MQAIEIAGGQAALARRCGVDRQAVWQWLERNRVPDAHVMTVCESTGWKVWPDELRPDIFTLEFRKRYRRNGA